jgi:hypothetical protein
LQHWDFSAIQTQQQAVVRSTQFVAQCVTVWEGLVEQPHVAQVRRVEAFAELARQGLSQLRQQSFAIGRPSLAALLDSTMCRPICQ